MKRILAIGLVVLTTSCSNNQSMVIDYGAKNAEKVQKIEPETAFLALENAPVCCDSLAEIDYRQISQPGKFDFNIFPQDKAFRFRSGKSFVKGIALPQVNGPIKVAISSPIISSVFVPSLLVLDESYNPIEVYGDETISYDKSSLVNVERLYGNIELPSEYPDGRKARYLVVFTTSEAMKGETTLAQPDPKLAEVGRESYAIRLYSNQPIPHTAIGAIRLAFDYQQSSQTQMSKYLATDNSADNRKQQAETILSEQEKKAAIGVTNE
ncbi:MalM family protein, partial [Photobacterium sp. OFAV2-7]|uniref:MalM family protein n=1 Tax=Photobacterium sp. OFAV2-7 TaxID=2917748 RepID=UPI001EF3D753